MPQTLPTLQLNSPQSKELNRLCIILQQQGYLSEKSFPAVASGGVNRFTVKIEDAVIYFQQTHLGPDGGPLAANGIVDADTWWALNNPSGAKQKSNLSPKIPKGIDGTRHIVLQHALTEHAKGVAEKPNGSNRSKDIDTYFPAWLLRGLSPSDKGPAWCCFFVNAMVTKALNGKRPWGPYLGSCAALWETVQKGEAPGFGEPWVPVTYQQHDRISPGDIFVMLHPKSPGKAQTGHVGFVLRVSKNGAFINTVEGNCGNRVKVGLRDTDTIHGFINLYGDGARVGFSRSLLPTPATGSDDTR